MQTGKSLNEILAREVVEEFTLPSGKKAKRYHFSARDAMQIQREFAARNQGKDKADDDDFQLLIVCKCIQIENNEGQFEHPFMEDFDTDKISGFDFLTLFGKVAGLTSEGGSKPNPK